MTLTKCEGRVNLTKTSVGEGMARKKATGKKGERVIRAKIAQTMERGVRLPPQRRYEVYNWSSMRIGDFFTVKGDLEARRRAQTAASTYKKRHPGWTYATRLEGRDLMRVWRLS